LAPKFKMGNSGGCSFMIRIRHAVAASLRRASPASSTNPMGRRLCLRSRCRYMKTYGLSHEQLAMVSVVQRE